MTPRSLPAPDQSVTYRPIGGTKAPDLEQNPPPGYHPLVRRARIGQGDERFEFASATVLTWGVQRNSGYQIISLPGGEALEQRWQLGDGTTGFVEVGDTVALKIPTGPFRITAPARVVYVVDEPDRRGFAYGTLPGHPERGEESFIVERAADGTIWFQLRAFSRPANLFWQLGGPVSSYFQAFYTRRYLASLSGPVR